VAAVHPFARNCEEVLARLLEILAGLKRAKEKTPKGPEGSKPGHKTGKLSDLPVLWLLGSSQMEQQAFAEGSARGINSNFDKRQGKGSKPTKASLSGDPVENALRQRYVAAMNRCREQNIKDNESYFRCRAQPMATAAGCKSLFVPMSCPAGDAAREALDAYLKSKPADSGGGSGGGW